MQASPMIYQVAVPEGVGPGMAFQANVGGQIMQVQCPQGVAPGQMIQVQGAATAQPQTTVIVQQTGPTVQAMNNDADGGLARILAPLNGLLVRQKLDKWEIVTQCWEKENKYKVAAKPDHFANIPYPDMTDDVFKKALKGGHVLTMKEKSDCCDRICCQNFRAFYMRVKPGKATKGLNWEEHNMLTFHRPFKCTCVGPCWICLPQEINALNNKNEHIGKVQETWMPGNCCCKRHWNITDRNSQLKYVMVDDQCSDCNCLAPTCCCPVRRFDLKDPTMTTVGGLRNIYPGCRTMRGCWGDADNYVIDFPADATAEDKATLLAASVLIDFQFFEKSENDGQSDWD